MFLVRDFTTARFALAPVVPFIPKCSCPPLAGRHDPKERFIGDVMTTYRQLYMDSLRVEMDKLLGHNSPPVGDGQDCLFLYAESAINWAQMGSPNYNISQPTLYKKVETIHSFSCHSGNPIYSKEQQFIMQRFNSAVFVGYEGKIRGTWAMNDLRNWLFAWADQQAYRRNITNILLLSPWGKYLWEYE